MEFKVGASLWVKSQESRVQAPVQKSGDDFRKKLELPPETEPDNERQPTESETPNFSRTQKGQKGLYHQHEELYDWGSSAAGHLSFISRSIAAAEVSLPRPAEPAASQPFFNVEAHFANAPDTDLRRVDGSSASNVVPEGPQRLPEVSQKAEQEGAAERLQKFFGQRWPQSSLSVFTRKEGLDVIVRDFYLSEEELGALTRDLKKTMRSSDEAVERIWINGRAVWQRVHSS